MMRWDQLAVRVMLWSLAATALCGVAAIFSSSHDVIFRLTATTMTTAAAAGLMWRATLLAEKPSTRLAGVCGMAAVLLEFFVLLALTWGSLIPSGLFDTSRFTELLAMTAFFIPITAAPAVSFLIYWHAPPAWLAARVGVAAAALAFVELMFSAWLPKGRFHFVEEAWFGAAGATASFGILTACCLVGTLRQRPWRWAGVAAAILGWLLFTAHSLQPTHSIPGQMLFTVTTSLAVLIAYTNVCLLPSLAPRHEIFRRATIGLAGLTTVLVDLLIFGRILIGSIQDDFLSRLSAASGIVTACGTVAIFILALLNRRSSAPEKFRAISWLEMTIICPACGANQKVPLGESACAQCRLPFSIRVGERPL